MWFQKLRIARFLIPGEDIGELPGKHIHCPLFGKTGDDPLVDEVKPPQVVYAVDMVGMGVGKENAVDMGNFLPDRLLSQVRRGIDQQVAPLRLNDYRGTGSFVLWI